MLSEDGSRRLAERGGYTYCRGCQIYSYSRGVDHFHEGKKLRLVAEQLTNYILRRSYYFSLDVDRDLEREEWLEVREGDLWSFFGVPLRLGVE